MTSDQELMHDICKGSHAAFAKLVRRHTDRYYTLAMRIVQNHGDAEDIVQTAFVKLWQNPASWNAKKSMFTTWFYRVVLNACRDFQRKHHRRVLLDEDSLNNVLQPTASEETLLAAKQIEKHQEKQLQCALKELSLAQQEALNLVVYCELPQRQAAEILGLSLKALESSLIRAKRNLANKVSKSNEADARDGIVNVVHCP